MNKPITPSNLLATTMVATPHHTVGDWDKPAAGWELDTDNYISPPSSLYFFLNAPHAFLCRLAGSLCLPSGRLVTYVRPFFLDDYWLTFRNQATLGTEEVKDCYLIATDRTSRIEFGKRVNNVYTLLAEWVTTWTIGIWQRVRVTWWTTYDDMNTPSLAVHLEVWEDEAWADKGIKYDTDNLWADSEVNRCGLASFHSGIGWDDTEIWKPTE